MIKIKILKNENIKFIDKLIINEGNIFNEFLKLGWSVNQIKNQINKNVNLSYGAFYKNLLISFIFGDLFYIEKESEYEILLIYVCKNFSCELPTQDIEQVKELLSK